MSAYTVSQLAHDVGVSVHIMRDYLVRGLLRPAACTRAVTACSTMPPCSAVHAAFGAGIGLDALARLCRALDECGSTARSTGAMTNVMWRARRDSNPRPLPSEGSTLSS